MRSLRWLFVAIPMVLAVAAMTYVVLDGRQKRQREERQFNERIAAVRLDVERLVRETDADTSWEARLADSSGFAPMKLLTLDLERAWLTSKPILFIGRVLDVASAGSESYRILLEHDFSRRLSFVLQKVRIEAVCPRAALPEIQSGREARDSLSSGIALSVKVRSISSAEKRDSDGEYSVFTGTGDCVGARFVREPDLLRWMTFGPPAQPPDAAGGAGRRR